MAKLCPKGKAAAKLSLKKESNKPELVQKWQQEKRNL